MKHEVEDGTAAGTAERGGLRPGEGPSEAQQKEMQKKAEAAGRPGVGHKALEPLVGSWKAEVKCWHEPGGSPQVSKGTAQARWILNGRFLEEEFHGEMMGKAFVGRTTLGYDNTKQEFNSVWISDMQTSMFTSEGRGEEGNKVITLEGQVDCPVSGKKDIRIKTVYRIDGPDKHTFEMFDASKGNAKTMEITYTRS